ncbi:hypothetical protein DFQ28_000682 [Apophysomyces sp. BC1034]|nr:hypothetical protein DFQ30_000713 [Apophysomyces sp. BC1015]KAG0191241.1 hypothetical protein DFQ28_000682 [Apophysomyces sp. BC1034]
MFAFDGAINNEDDPYFSLSQFDLELQQQAQVSLQQGAAINHWQDFDKYLPIDCNPFLLQPSNVQHVTPPHSNNITLTPQSIFMDNQLFPPQSNLNYDQLANLVGTSQLISAKPAPSFTEQVVTPVVPSQWESATNPMPTDSAVIKQEPEVMSYASPPPESISVQPTANGEMQQEDSFQTVSKDSPQVQPITASPAISVTSPPDFRGQMSWNSPSSFPDTQGKFFYKEIPLADKKKVPIHRLKNPASPTTSISQQSSVAPPVNRQQKKTAHNAIERRYRNNINDRIAELKNAVPALLHAKLKDSRTGKRSHRSMEDDDEEAEDGEEYLDGVAVATKLNKATILRKATEYITHLKKTGDDMRRENVALQHILGQLPGGQDILVRYRMQKMQREQELHRQLLHERQMQKQQQQQRKAANRKRARQSSQEAHTDPYESSSSASSDPVTPPAMTNRVFMAIFMCLTFFTTSPLTSGANSTEQYQNHQHASRSSSTDSGTISSTGTTYATESNFFGSWFQFDDGWTALRTIVFVICIGQLLVPFFKSWAFAKAFKVRRVPRSKRTALRKRRLPAKSNATVPSLLVTPGDQKCMQIYDILVKSLEHNGDAPPRSTAGSLLPLFKESARLFSRHIFGYEIFYAAETQLTPQEEWGQVCKWIKLNEVECLGGNPDATRISMIHSCFRMINLIETLDSDDYEHICRSRARVYATAAMQLAVLIPNRSLATKLSGYFWRLAVYEANLDDSNEESASWMDSLMWDHETDDEEEHSMLSSRAWDEALEIVRRQTSLHDASTKGLSLSLTAPVLVPVALLSTLHTLDSLRSEFGRLILSMTADDMDDPVRTAFGPILAMASPHQDDNENDEQRLSCWLAAVGATAEALWNNDLPTAEQRLTTVLQRVPRSLAVMEFPLDDVIAHKAKMSQLDELAKKSMVHILSAAVLMKKGPEEQKAGFTELLKAEAIRANIKKLLAKGKESTRKTAKLDDGVWTQDQGLETAVMALAEFVVAVVGLEAWVLAMKIPAMVDARDHVRQATLTLRRMIRRPSLEGLRTNQIMVDRLSRLGRFVACQAGEVDSACESSDFESDEETMWDDSLDEADDGDENGVWAKRTEKALDILHGVA